MKALLITKDNPPGRAAERMLREAGWEVEVAAAGAPGQRLPERVLGWEGDFLVSFLAQWVLPEAVINRARVQAVNFHPGPPEYPGTGCYNFAIYDEAPAYGATCHVMAPRVDAGDILAVSRFPLLPEDSVATLRERTLDHLLRLLEAWLGAQVGGRPMAPCGERWARAATTRRQLEALGEITLGMDERDALRRIRAMHFPGFPGARLRVGGRIFALVPEDD